MHNSDPSSLPTAVGKTTASGKVKLRLIFLPFLLAAIAFIIIYTFLDWLFFINQDLVRLREPIRIIWLPLLLCWLPFYIWQVPRIQLFALSDSQRLSARKKTTGLILLAGLCIALPLILTQRYFTGTSERLAILENVQDILRYKTAESFTIKDYHIDKDYVKTYLKQDNANTSAPNTDLTCYIVCPIYDIEHPAKPQPPRPGKNQPAPRPPAKISIYPIAWIGAKYQRQLDNKLAPAARQQEILAFEQTSLADFARQPVNGYTYFDNLSEGKDYTSYQQAISKADRFTAGMRLLLLQPQRKPFNDTDTVQLAWIAISFLIGALVYLLLILFIPLDPEKVNAWVAAQQERRQRGDLELPELLLPARGYIATPLLLYLNIIVFIIVACAGFGFFEFNGKALAQWGANYGPYTFHGQYWRLLSCLFLNEGIIHMLFNMYALIFVGHTLEPVIGSRRFITCFLLTGIIANFVIVKMYPTDVVVVGCSDAIFGMYGLILANLFSGTMQPKFKRDFLISVFLFICFNLWRGYTGDIDNVAHVAALIAGLLLGFVPGLRLRHAARRSRT